ncbi:MAG: DUF401 family protein [Bacillota bacterium]
MRILQAFGVLAAFVIIVVLSVKRVALWKVMCLATIVMALSSGIPMSQSAKIIWGSFTDITTIHLALSVFSIGAFSTIMNGTGYLDNMVRGLSGLLGNLKAAIMAVPALVGSMPVLGGAAVSAPLVDKLGDGLGLSPEKKATANLVFRHGMFFVFPFSPSMILVSNLLGVPVTSLLAKLWPYGLMFWIAGYIFLLRKEGKNGQASAFEDESAATGPMAANPKEYRVRSLTGFLRYGSPLLVALALSLVFGLPLWASMATGIILALAIASLEKAPVPSLGTILKGSNISQVVAMLWIMAFKGFVSISPVFPALVDSARGLGIPPAMLAVVLPILFGYVSASHTTTMGVLVPILVPAGVSQEGILYLTAAIYGAGFIAYFASPLHLCQVLTCQYYKIDITKVYKLYWPVLLAVGGIMMLYAMIATGLF